MARKPDAKAALKEFYESCDPEELAAQGRAHLQQDLRITSPRLVRWGWLLAWGFLALLAWAAALAAVYVLEKTRTAADHFERDRASQLKAQEVPSE